MATLAAVVLPEIGAAIDDARESAMLANLQELNLAIERYKLHHGGYPPDDLSGNTLSQLTTSTDEYGDRGTGAAYPYGPYLLTGIMANPFNGSSSVTLATETPPSNLKSLTGWIYDPATGQIWGGEKRR